MARGPRALQLGKGARTGAEPRSPRAATANEAEQNGKAATSRSTPKRVAVANRSYKKGKRCHSLSAKPKPMVNYLICKYFGSSRLGMTKFVALELWLGAQIECGFSVPRWPVAPRDRRAGLCDLPGVFRADSVRRDG